jgi:hypothetical protein
VDVFPQITVFFEFVMLQKLVTGIENRLDTLVYSGSAKEVHTGCNHPKVHPVVSVNGYPPGRLSSGDIVSCQTKDGEKLFSFRCIVNNVDTSKKPPTADKSSADPIVPVALVCFVPTGWAGASDGREIVLYQMPPSSAFHIFSAAREGKGKSSICLDRVEIADFNVDVIEVNEVCTTLATNTLCNSATVSALCLNSVPMLTKAIFDKAEVSSQLSLAICTRRPLSFDHRRFASLYRVSCVD